MRERPLRDLGPDSVDRASTKRPSAGREVSGIHKKVEVPQSERRRAMFGVFKKHQKLFEAAQMLVAAGSFGMAAGVHSDPDLASAYGGYLATSFLDRSPASVEDARRLYRLTSRVDGVFDDIIRHSERRHEAELGEPRPTLIEGFDEVHVSSTWIQDAIKQGFPRGWDDGRRVARIAYDAEAEWRIPYPGMEGKKAVAWHTALEAGRSEIVFSKSQFNETALLPIQVHQFFTQTLIHELAHAHNWDDGAQLTPSEARRLHEVVIEQSLAPGRPLFAYPEDIHASSAADERRARTEHAEEYFAELVSASLRPYQQVDGSSPSNWLAWEAAFADALFHIYNASEEEAEKNAHIMRWFFTKSDPNFRPWIASIKIERIANQAMMEAGFAHFPNMVTLLPVDLAEILIDEMQHTEKNDAAAASRRTSQDISANSMNARIAFRATLQRESREMMGEAGLHAFSLWANLVGSTMAISRMSSVASQSRARISWDNMQTSIGRFTAAWSSLPQAQRANFERLLGVYAKGVIHEDFHYIERVPR